VRARSRSGLLILALLACPGASAHAREGSAPLPPLRGILLVTIDTLRADHVGAYGAPFPTPALDALAAEGVLLEQACTPTPSTGPAHASLLTGLHPWNHGTLRNAVALDPRIPTLADRLRQHGFATAAFVSSYVLDRRFGFHQGFDTFWFEPDQELVWRGQGGQKFYATRGDATTRAAMAWITENAERPFFVWVHYFDPHTPYDPPPGYAVSPEVPVSLEGKRLGSDTSPASLERLIRNYRGEVLYADAQLGRLVERLRILQLLDRSAVIATSDHGEGLGDHGVLEHGKVLFDELVRVPVLIRAPGLEAGRRLEGDAQLEDLAPTLLALAGVEAPEGLDGRNLLPWLRGEVESSPRDAVLGRRRPFKSQRDQYYERRWPHKWIGALEGPGLAIDLDADPRELRPEPGAGPPERLKRAVAGAGADARGVDPDPEVRRALEALGYAEE
jgi:arylsulfatase A-like enzyme